jgi:hypothetical protein
VNSSRFLNFSYATPGRYTYHETQTWNGTAWQLYRRTTYSYPAVGLGISSVSEVQVGSTWQNQERFINRYDAQDTHLGFTFETWENNAWTLYGGFRNIISYNADNDLARQLTQNVDFNTHMFVNSTKSFYSNYQTITLGNKAKAQVAEMQLSPNPTSGKVTLALSGLQGSGEAQVVVSNTLGQTVQQVTVRPQAGMVRQTLHLAGLPAGVYSVSVHTPTGIVTKKLLHE